VLGGGIWNNNDPIEISGSIVAGNTAGDGSADLEPGTGTLTVEYSLIGDAAGLSIIGPGNILNQDPMLASLADNGGPTFTHAFLPSSPAIDAGDPLAVAGVGDVPEFDQRGSPFDRVIGDAIDIGAYEDQIVAPDSADFDGSGFITGLDFLMWQIGFGTPAPNAIKTDGDADNDTDVDGDDLDVWESQFGEIVSPILTAVTSNQSAPVQTAVISASPAVEPIAPAELIDAVMAMELLSTSIGGNEVVVGEEQLPAETFFDQTFAPNDIALPSALSSFPASRTTSSVESDEAITEWFSDDAVDEVFERVFG
jgi:hypothetical protein